MAKGKTMKNSRSVMGRKKTMKITKTVKVPQLKDTQKAGVLAVVRRLLDRNTEDKYVGSQVEYNVLHNSAISANDCEPVIMEIEPVDSTTGSTARQRIGNKIKPKALKVKGVIALDADYLNTQKDIYARVIIATQKDVKVGSSVLGGGVDASHLLRAGFGGGADEVQFNGYTMDLNYPVNTDKFRVYMDKVFKLSGCDVDGNEAIQRYSHRFAYTFKKLPATLSFDDGNGDWPNNFAPFIAVGYCYSDGTSPDTVSTKLTHTCYSQLQFEDL